MFGYIIGIQDPFTHDISSFFFLTVFLSPISCLLSLFSLVRGRAIIKAILILFSLLLSATSITRTGTNTNSITLSFSY